MGRRFSSASIDHAMLWLIQLRITRFIVGRRLLPNGWDICFVSGLILIGWVLYQLTPLLAESWLALLLILTGALHGITRSTR